MCQKPECSHKGDVMCSCRAIKSKDPLLQTIHLLANIREPKAELSYETLESPYPLRLCVFGTCKNCGGRLCVRVGVSVNLSGDDFLAAVYRSLYQGFRSHFNISSEAFRQMFAELFHEQDRPHIRYWLERPENQSALQLYRKNMKTPPERQGTATVYTIIQTAVDIDGGSFPTPVTHGTYLSIDRAREHLADLIAEEQKTLSSRYDTKDLTEDSWEAYESGYAASCFVRIEILSSELFPDLGEGGAV